MLLLLPAALLLISLLAVLILAQIPRTARYVWLIAIGGAGLSWISLFSLYPFLPLGIELPLQGLPEEKLAFQVEMPGWIYALTLLSLTLAVLLADLPNEIPQRPVIAFGNLILALMGMMAIFSATPLTLAFLWAAIDLSEWVALVRSAASPHAIRSLSLGMGLRILGLLLLLCAGVVSLREGIPLRVGQIAPQATPLLAIALALRLGIFPLHLPYPQESLLRRGFGTQLRAVAIASAVALLAYLPAIPSPLLWWLVTPLGLAGLLASWNWLNASDALDGRVFWGMAAGSMAIFSALVGDREGSLAWGVLTLSGGGLLFLLAFDHRALRAFTLIGWWALSGLPYSLAAASAWDVYPMGMRIGMGILQTLLGLGYLLHWQRKRPPLEEQPTWVRNTHFLAILLLSILLIALGFWQPAPVSQALFALPAVILTWALFLLRRRLRILSPLRAHWIHPTGSRSWWQLSETVLDLLYRLLNALFQGFNNLLEGASGLLWSLLVLLILLTFFLTRP
jgi:hypothetical protein